MSDSKRGTNLKRKGDREKGKRVRGQKVYKKENK
jgi:hypothetical protein